MVSLVRKEEVYVMYRSWASYLDSYEERGGISKSTNAIT